MKSTTQLLAEKFEEMERRGLTATVKVIRGSKDSIEKKLTECDAALKPVGSTRKHNGAGDNAIRETFSESGRRSPSTSTVIAKKETLAKALVAKGFSESEAKGIAGFPDDLRLKELVDAGVSTEDAFKSLVDVARVFGDRRKRHRRTGRR
jgi:hypothetical protein